VKNDQLIIMSVDKNYSVGYSEDGQFIKIPKNPTHRVGQMINYQPTKTGLRLHWGISVAAVFLLVFITGVFGPFFQQEAAAAYMSIGLNTGSMEIWTDNNNKVIETKYTNFLKQLSQIDLKGKDIYEAVTVLTLEAKEKGLITENNNDILLINLIDLKESSKHHVAEDRIEKIILEGLDTKEYHGLMMMGRQDKDYLVKANKLNLTASQYEIYEKSSAKGHKLNMEKLQKGEVRSVLEEAGTTPEEIFEMQNNFMQNKSMHNNSKNGMFVPNETSDPINEPAESEQNQENMMKEEQDTKNNNFMENDNETDDMHMENYNKMHN